MAFRKIRQLTLVVVVVAFPMGFLAGNAGVPPEVMVPVILVFTGVASLGCRKYQQRLRRRGVFDERHEEIKLKASNGTLVGLYVGLLPLALVVLLLDPDLPIGWLLIGVVFGSSVLYEVLVEWYRRRI